MSFDVCILGHITRDLIRIPGRPDQEQAGGTAFYAAVALASLGLDVVVVTKVAVEDEGSLLEPLRARGITVFNGPTPRTTVFENIYRDAQLGARRQRVASVAAPFRVDDVSGIAARAFHLGPLTRDELAPGVLEAIGRRTRARRALLSLDAQGLLRRVRGGAVELGGPEDAPALTRHTGVLKVDDAEAERITGEREPEAAAAALEAAGAREVLVTFADRGSLLRTGGSTTRIPALAPARVVDATGCGDTFASAYVARRIQGVAPGDAAWFAAATASLKLERYGAFEGTTAAVEARLAEALGAPVLTCVGA